MTTSPTNPRTARHNKEAPMTDRSQVLPEGEGGSSRAVPASYGWRSIDSAPKDGESFLAIAADAYSPQACVAWWQNDAWTQYSRPEEKWHGGVCKWFPSHWMPLPEGPGTARHPTPSPRDQERRDEDSARAVLRSSADAQLIDQARELWRKARKEGDLATEGPWMGARGWMEPPGNQYWSVTATRTPKAAGANSYIVSKALTQDPDVAALLTFISTGLPRLCDLADQGLSQPPAPRTAREPTPTASSGGVGREDSPRAVPQQSEGE